MRICMLLAHIQYVDAAFRSRRVFNTTAFAAATRSRWRHVCLEVHLSKGGHPKTFLWQKYMNLVRFELTAAAWLHINSRRTLI